MPNLPLGTANDQMKKFELAETPMGGYTGELHEDLHNIKKGDLVFKVNNNGIATHVMIATGKIKVDKNGNVTHIQVIHSPASGEQVEYKYYQVDKNYIYKVGHTKRKTDYNSFGTTWNDFIQWVERNNLWGKFK